MLMQRGKTLVIGLLVAVIALGAGIAAAHDSGTEVRITAMRLEDGRIEVALQEREGSGWGERILPARRFFPASGREGRWLSSSPIPVGMVETTDLVVTNLESATYLTENTRDGSAALEGGEFRAPAAPGSAAELVIRLGKWSLGDLDGQGELDAAAITVEEPGGSGTFFYLHALIKDDDDLRDAGVAFLGDRIRIEGVSVHAGVITVATLDRRPDEPFAATPSVPLIRQFRLQGGALTEVGDASSGAFACDSTLPDAALVIVHSPESGATVSSGFGVSGCSRTHESNVVWQLLDRSGAVLAEGFTSGGGFDGPGEFSFTVEYESAERQLAHLEVFELDESDGEGFPPPRDIVPLLLEAAP